MFCWQPCKLVFGTLYPTYQSYKALKHRDTQECIRLMMYWVVFTIFSTLEGFLDLFIGLWMPFYYESKLVFVLWLVSPYGNGAKILYENFVQPRLHQHEHTIDECISYLQEFTIQLFWKFWSKFAVYFNFMFIILLDKAQALFIHYMSGKTTNSFTDNLQMLLMVSEQVKPQKLHLKQIEAGETTDVSSKQIEAGETTDVSTDTSEQVIRPKKLKPVRKPKKAKLKELKTELEDLDNIINNKRVTRSTSKRGAATSNVSDVDID